VREPNLIVSGLCKTVIEGGHKLKIEICRLEHDPNWSLEVVNEQGTSTVWDDLFPTDDAALAEALKTIREEGLSAFLDNANVIEFPKRT
jgi:hypothetical protein